MAERSLLSASKEDSYRLLYPRPIYGRQGPPKAREWTVFFVVMDFKDIILSGERGERGQHGSDAGEDNAGTWTLRVRDR